MASKFLVLFFGSITGKAVGSLWDASISACADWVRTNKEVGFGSESPTKDRRVQFAVDMPTAEPTGL